ncbi:MAG: hypothetical protein ABJQ71_15195 [Roseibium sp.]
MQWLAALRAVAGFLREITALVRERQLLKAGRAEAIAETFKEAANALQHARNAEHAIRAELDAHPDRLHDDDGFRRD